MCTNIISTRDLLTKDERAAIDALCASRPGSSGILPDLAQFLARFHVSLVLDQGVIGGFVKDSSNLPGQADALARPGSEHECALILYACHVAGLPVTVSGGKSNLTGSATPAGGVILSTVKLVDPECEIHQDAARVTTSPGVILETLRRKVLEGTGGGRVFPVDPTSRAEASVGGAIACNCSGFTPGASGALREWLQSIRLLLPDGRLVCAERGQYLSQDGTFVIDGTAWEVPRYERPRIKNAGGPFSAPDGVMDLIDLVVGSEGIFGVVTACTLRLARHPGDCIDIFFSLPGEAEALLMLQKIFETFGGRMDDLRACEYFGVNCRRYMTHADVLFYKDDQVGVYIQEPLAGREEMDVAGAWLALLDDAGLELDEAAIHVLDSERLRTLFMEARHSMPAHSLELAHQREAFTLMTDTVVPAPRFSEFLDFTHKVLQDRELDYLSFGHLGDCHLHFTIVPHKAQIESAVDAYDRIVEKSAALGGVYSGEHGTGKRKRKDFLCCYGRAAADQVRRARLAIDPNLRFNRGNVIEA